MHCLGLNNVFQLYENSKELFYFVPLLTAVCLCECVKRAFILNITGVTQFPTVTVFILMLQPENSTNCWSFSESLQVQREAEQTAAAHLPGGVDPFILAAGGQYLTLVHIRTTRLMETRPKVPHVLETS